MTTTVSTSSPRRTPRRDESDLRRQVREQAVLLTALSEEVAELRALVVRTQRETMHRIKEVRSDPGPAPEVDPVATRTDPSEADDAARPAAVEPSTDRPVARAAPMALTEYRRVVTRIRTLVRTVVPVGSTLAVVSRGDHALVDLDGRRGWHFPRGADGRYAGHHPEDSRSAIAQLEDLRCAGARFLVVPVTAAWWLEYYEEFRRHLESCSRVLVRQDDTCVIFALDAGTASR